MLELADDTSIADHLDRLPKHEVLLFLASMRYIGADASDPAAFKATLMERHADVAELMATRRTQTNEVGRASMLLPALGDLEAPLALIEVGCSMGLLLQLDRFHYDYGPSGSVGETTSPVRLTCEARGPVPVPTQMPEILWRQGIDIAPLDVYDDDAVAWLRACIWPDRPDREARLDAAVKLARVNPAPVIEGDLVAALDQVVANAPNDATVVVFHAHVLMYVDRARRLVFAERLKELGVRWISIEGSSILRDVRAVPVVDESLGGVLDRDGAPLAATSPHGDWVDWRFA